MAAQTQPDKDNETSVQPQSAAPSNKPKKSSRRDSISHAVFPTTIRLHSRHAQRAYKRGFETASRALYALAILLPIYANEEKAAQVGEHAGAMIAEMHQEMAEEIKRMNQVAEEHGIELEAVQYTHTLEMGAEISTPRASQYLGLIKEMDRLVSLIDVLWLSGVYDDQQHNNGAYHWQREIIKLANQLRTLSGQAISMAQNKGGPNRDADTEASTGDAAANGNDGSSADTNTDAEPDDTDTDTQPTDSEHTSELASGSNA